MGSMNQTSSEIRSANYRKPVYLARQVLTEANITSFPVSLRAVLRHYGIRVMKYVDFAVAHDMTMDECFAEFGKDGATIAKGGKYVIVYNHQVTPKERIRFTLAHELGHVFLKHHDELGVEILQRLWVEKSLYDVLEDEANCFARNLLCPPLATADLLRLHGIAAVQFDARQQRNVWLKVSTAPCLPGTPDSVTDHDLVREAFMITDKAANVRCHFLKDDIQNLQPKDRVPPYIIKHNADWRCTRCGVLRLSGAAFCYACGAHNRFGFVFREDPPALPAAVHYHGTHFRFCLFCGNVHISDDALFCMMCGKPVSNPCIPDRLREKNASSGLALLNVQTRHLCPPGVRYCPDCGSRTLFRVSGIDDGLGSDVGASVACDEHALDSKPADKNDPCRMNRDRRLAKCLYCGQSRHDADACFCTMCGKPVVNSCTACSHRNIANARYCEKCGQMTAFMAAGLLPVSGEYRLPPAQPEGEYTRAKRMDDKCRQERADRDRRLKELAKQYE